MPMQNRVTPYGELIAVQDRGTFLGFRGVLHDRQRNLVRYSSGKAWADTHPGAQVSATTIDNGLHADRACRFGVRRTFTAELDGLPDGTMVTLDDRYWLAAGDQLLAWSPGGYRDPRPRPRATWVTVITPRSTVAVLGGRRTSQPVCDYEGRPTGRTSRAAGVGEAGPRWR